MGPSPGFMSRVFEYFNAEMEKRGHEGLHYPEAEGDISEILLAADMGSLASKNGREKIMKIRMENKNFRKDDFETVQKYKALGIDLDPGEAALLSAFDSAFQARDMMKDEMYRKWLDGLIEESKGLEFSYEEGGEKISWQTASEKKMKYDKAVRKRIKESHKETVEA